MSQLTRKQLYYGASLAVLATIIWAGNFIVARGVANEIPPVSLAFYRWATASIIIIPIAFGKMRAQWSLIKANFRFIAWSAFLGVTVFNTLIYIAGHYTSAINMALIGTTSSPVFVIIISALFFGVKIHPIRIAGVICCIAGIIVLLSKGSWETLSNFRFGTGDLWVLVSALAFAMYNIQVKRKPTELSSRAFLGAIFIVGTLMLLPFYIAEHLQSPPVQWNNQLLSIIFYLGAGTSVTAFLLWNAAIHEIGAVRTALFGNLIPIFASLEAIWILGETLTITHIVSAAFVIIGLMLANSRKANQPHPAVAKP